MLLVAGNKKSTPKKRIFRVPYAVNSTPYIVNLEFLLGLLDPLCSQL